MPAANRYKFPFRPGDPQQPTSVRGAYLQNLVDCVHVCILRGLYDKARRAWAILVSSANDCNRVESYAVRCPDIDWKERWGWGLFLLTRDSDGRQSVSENSESLSRRGQDGATDYLTKLRLQVKPAEKPAVLEELAQHLVYTGRYEPALNELETYLVDAPYNKSASLHCYAGLISFWLAQPESKRREARDGPSSDAGSETSRRRGSSSSSSDVEEVEPPNESKLQKARYHFGNALQIDPSHTVAKGFIDLIDNPSLLDKSALLSPGSSSLGGRSRAQSVDMLSPSPRLAALDMMSGDSYRGYSSPRSRSRSRADSPPDQGTARSFGAMSLDADDDLGSGLHLGRAGMGLGNLARLTGLSELTSTSRNASVTDLADVRGEESDASRDSMDSLDLASDDGESQTSATDARSASPDSQGMDVDMDWE